MTHLKAVNRKAARIERFVQDTAQAAQSAQAAPLAQEAAVAADDNDVVALQRRGSPPQQPEAAHIPLGCSLVFSPGWEADRTGGTAGLCQPVERDLFDCHIGCYWPAQVPDQLNHAPDWTSKCAAAQKDWRKIDLVFP
jgi:hypothetical protein